MTHLPESIIYFWYESSPVDQEPYTIKEHAATYEQEAHNSSLTVPFQRVLETIAGNTSANQCFTGWSLNHIDMGFRSIPALSLRQGNLLEPDIFEKQRRKLLGSLWMCLLLLQPLSRARFI